MWDGPPSRRRDSGLSVCNGQFQALCGISTEQTNTEKSLAGSRPECNGDAFKENRTTIFNDAAYCVHGCRVLRDFSSCHRSTAG